MTQDLENIKTRNARVEADKAWEISNTRRIVIALGTYLIIGAYLSYLDVEKAWLHALVPPMAYVLSTLSLPIIKTLWLQNIYKKRDET